MRHLSDAMIDYIFNENFDINSIIDALRREPAIVDLRSSEGDQLIHVACWSKNADLVAFLLQNGGSPNARGCYSRTPLHYAVHEGDGASADIVGMLMDAGADPTLKEENGFTAIDWARIEMDEGDSLERVVQLMSTR